MRGEAHAIARFWKSEDNLGELVFSYHIGSQGSHSGFQTWCQMPLPTEPSRWPLRGSLKTSLFKKPDSGLTAKLCIKLSSHYPPQQPLSLLVPLSTFITAVELSKVWFFFFHSRADPEKTLLGWLGPQSTSEPSILTRDHSIMTVVSWSHRLSLCPLERGISQDVLEEQNL